MFKNCNILQKQLHNLFKCVCTPQFMIKTKIYVFLTNWIYFYIHQFSLCEKSLILLQYLFVVFCFCFCIYIIFWPSSWPVQKIVAGEEQPLPIGFSLSTSRFSVVSMVRLVQLLMKVSLAVRVEKPDRAPYLWHQCLFYFNAANQKDTRQFPQRTRAKFHTMSNRHMHPFCVSMRTQSTAITL